MNAQGVITHAIESDESDTEMDCEEFLAQDVESHPEMEKLVAKAEEVSLSLAEPNRVTPCFEVW